MSRHERDLSLDLFKGEPEVVFQWSRSDLGESLSDAFVALDTNVLLLPYEMKEDDWNAILDTYRELAEQRRLVVPGHVAREFARGRIDKLASLNQRINNVKSEAGLTVLDETPLFADTDEFEEFREAHQAVTDALDPYKKSLRRLAKRVRQFPDHDPIKEGYGEIFNNDVVVDPSFDVARACEEFRQRQEQGFPPGYKDSGKSQNAEGDYLIWKTLLEITQGTGKDLIFVTSDRKADWWHQSDRAAFAPRFELIEEYRFTSGGGTLHLVNLNELLELMGAPDAVTADVRDKEQSAEGAANSVPALAVFDKQVVLIRGDAGFGAVVPHTQKAGVAGAESVYYVSWYADQLSSFYDMRNIEPISQEARSGAGLDRPILVGPYSIPWSLAGASQGWFYSWQSSSSEPRYEMAVLPGPGFGLSDFGSVTFS